MIDAIECMGGRTLFEGRAPADGDAAISIGDPAVGRVLSLWD